MSDSNPLKEVLPSQSCQEPQPENPLMEETGKALLTDTTPQVETNPASPLALETDEHVVEPVVESRIQKVCKTMCVTTISSLMVIAWASTLMLFSGFASYRVIATMPFFREGFDEWFYYPTTCALVVVLLLSPVYAVVGDVRCGNFRMLLVGLTPFSVVIVAVVVLVPISVSVAVIAALYYIGLVFVVFVLFLTVGIFQTNAIQFGRAALRDIKSPELSAFIHWYYWALYLPTLLTSTPWMTFFLFPNEGDLTITIFVLCSVILFASLMLLGITSMAHLAYRVTGKFVTEQRIAKNPVTLVCRVTRYTLRHPASPGHGGFFTRLSNIRQSRGGPADDEEVGSVAKFWLLVLLIASSFGFVFWDDMWAVPAVNALFGGPVDLLYYSSDHYFTSSEVTVSAVIFICVPIYQLIVRPFMGKHSFPLLLRIWIGLILELISLALVTWSSAVTTSRISPEQLSNISDHICRAQELTDLEVESFDWEILFIPQVISGFSQLLVFPAVIVLILTDAPRVMHGLLIGLWYSLQSIHYIVGIIEAATCAVLYWQYYLMKIALVLISIVSFGSTAIYYNRKQALFRNRLTPMEDQTEIVACSEGTV